MLNTIEVLARIKNSIIVIITGRGDSSSSSSVNYQTFKGMVNKSSLTNIHVGVCMSYLVANRTWMWQLRI